jgi:hypothetical protein
MPILMVCGASHIGRRFLVVRKPDFGASFEVSGIAVSVLGGTGTVYNFPSRAISRVPVSYTATGEFMPASGRLFGSAL